MKIIDQFEVLKLDSCEVIEYLLGPIINRKEIFDVAIDRGLGDGMQIEKWILIEMLAQLKKLKEQGVLSIVEGEHKYSIKKSSRYEHCDLWWEYNDHEFWLEVKTIVFSLSGQRGKYQDIFTDKEKCKRISTDCSFLHLVFIFPIKADFKEKELVEAYKGFSLLKRWEFKLCTEKNLLVLLYKSGAVES